MRLEAEVGGNTIPNLDLNVGYKPDRVKTEVTSVPVNGPGFVPITFRVTSRIVRLVPRNYEIIGLIQPITAN